MKKIISLLNPTRLFRVLTVFLAGLLVIVTTACSDGPANALDKNGRPEVPSNAVSSPYEGGMNGYSDVDPRANTSGVSAKAKGIVDNAEGNIQKRADSFGKYADNYTSGTPLNERVDNLAKDVTKSAKGTAEGVAKGAQRGVENLKDNTQNAAKSVPNVVEEATQNAKNTGRDAAKAGEKISNSLQENSQRAFSNHSIDVD